MSSSFHSLSSGTESDDFSGIIQRVPETAKLSAGNDLISVSQRTEFGKKNS